MSLISDFIDNLVALSSIEVDGSREAVPVNALIANVSHTGEAVAVGVNDGFSTLAYSGQGYRTVSNIQIDIYSKSYVRLMEMKSQIIDTYHGKALTLGSTVFHQMKVTFSQESAAALNNTVYRAIVTLETIT